MATFVLAASNLMALEPAAKPAPAAPVAPAAPAEQKLDKKKVSYALGYNYGKALIKNDKNIDVAEIVKGLQDGLNPNATGKIEEKDIQDLLMSYYMEIRKVFAEEQEKLKEKNLQEGKTFLEQNKKKPGVVEDASGLQYKVISEGSGPTPKENDTVEVEITAKTIGGKTFFSTKEEGTPAVIEVAKVIPGWSIALQKMKKGSTWELYVPPTLGYGDRSVSEDIGPNSTLIFDVHLVDIKPAETPVKKEEAK